MRRFNILSSKLNIKERYISSPQSKTISFYVFSGNNVNGGVISATTSASSQVYDNDLLKFKRLAAQWRKERNPLSSFAQENIKIPAYQQIIGMGKNAIPYILSELKEDLKRGQANSWFYALWAIADENPVPEKSRGNVREMAAAWFEWGVEAGYVRQGDIGGFVSQSERQRLGAEKRVY